MKAIKFIIGLILLPVCWVTLQTFFQLFKSEAAAGAFYNIPEFFFFSAGAIGGLLVFLVAKSNKVLMWLYVAGHELTHALFAMLFRGKVSDIKITATQGGHIKTNRSNFVITLAPYFFPFYTILAVLIWAILEWQFFNFSDSDRFWLYGIVGLTWMFHIAYTIWMLQREQSDITVNGRLFSYTVIFLINLLIISCLLITASSSASFASYFATWWQYANRLLP